MNYALATLWHERPRYLPGILAIAFSAVLMALQCGLLLGLFSVTSIPIDNTRADIWVGSPQVLSVDLGRAIPLNFISRITGEPGVKMPEPFYQQFANWTKSDGGSDLCIVIGSLLEDGDIGTLQALTQDMRMKLTQPGSIVVDSDEMDRLKVRFIGDYAEINKQRVQIVGTVRGFKSLAGPYVFCSAATARELLKIVIPSDHSTYLLAKCDNPAEASAIAARLSEKYPDMSVFTSEDFSYRSRKHWLLKTKAGVAIGYAALLGLLVGMVVTSQTLYAAVTASAREYAILLALGIPRKRIMWTVLVQSFWMGLVGIIIAYPAVLALKAGAALLGVNVLLLWWVLAGTAAVTMTMAMISGMYALRSVRQIQPMTLLR